MIDNFSNDIYSANIYFFFFLDLFSNKRQISALDSRIKSSEQFFYLQPRTGTYINIRKLLSAGFMNISRKMFSCQ